MRVVLCWLLLSACVPRARYRLLSEADQRDARAAAIDLAAMTQRAERLRVDLTDESIKATRLSEKLAAEQAALAEARATFAEEKATLLKDRVRLRATMDELERAIRDLERRRSAAEARVAAYRDLLDRFAELIDAGTLQVKIVDGRMVVELATDILFASGRAALSDDGARTIDQVAAILAAIPDRAYQVEGHTDDVPIHTQRFPSNWELAAARAIGVARRLVDGGVGAERVSAAAYGEHRPVGDNDTDAGRAANRRIEIVVVPDLSELPGADELGSVR